MTSSIGNQIPEGLFKKLQDRDFTSKGSEVIIFTTIDDDAFPRHGMLSYYEIYAKDRSTLFALVYSGSRTAANVRRTGKITLLVVDRDHSLYVKANCKEITDSIQAKASKFETVFVLSIKDVLEDKVPTAKITGGIKFEGYDKNKETLESRLEAFENLRKIAEKESKGPGC
jgi:hypothetical protein